MKGYKQFLDKEGFNKNTQRLKVTKIKETSKGFIIHLFTNYVSLIYKYVTTYKNGTAKVITKVNTNYRPKYQYTSYENSEGEEITIKEFKSLQNN